MAALTIRSASKRFGGVDVLREVSLDVESGEFVALLGASGSGKSTLLRIVAGLETADTGNVILDGRDVTELPPDQRELAMVFQSYALYPHKSVAENIALPLQMRRLAPWQRWPFMRHLPIVKALRASIDAEVARAAAIVGMEALLDRKPGQLSGGQRQRAALARAMVRKPRLLLMDEPLSNLDAKLRQRMRTEISDLHRSTGATILYVTHDQIEAMTMADRIAVMVDGQIAQVGTPQSLYADPADVRIAEMLGNPAINLLEGEAVAEGVRAGGEIWRCPPGVARGTRVTLGFRPEQPVLGAAGEGVAVQVRRTEHLGAERLLHIKFASGAPAILKTPLSSPYGNDQTLHLSIAPDSLLLFDADGRRLRAAGS